MKRSVPTFYQGYCGSLEGTRVASYPGRVGGGKRGLVYTVCACASCVRELTVKDFVNSRLLNGMNMRAKNADFTFLSV